MARFASVAAYGGKAYVAGNNISFFGDEVTPGQTLTIAADDGSDIGRPPGDFAFAFPRLAFDSQGRLHMLWGEPSSVSARMPAHRWVNTPLTQVWTARLEGRAGWSKPQKLYERGNLRWGLSAAVPLARNADGALSTTIYTAGVGTPPVAALLRLTDGEWTATEIELSLSPAYLSGAVSASGAVLAIVAADRSAPGKDVNSLFFMRQTGDAWTTPSLVARSGVNPVFYVAALSRGDGDIHMLWLQRFPERAILRHALSTDGGASWSAIDDQELPTGLDGLRSVLDPCGGVHLIGEHWDEARKKSHLDHLSWRGGWQVSAHLFPSLRVTSTDLTIDSDGRLVAAFLAQPADSPPEAAVATMLTELRR